MSLGECVYREKASDKWDIPWHSKKEHFITILYHALENTVDKIIQAHNGKAEFDTVEYTTFFSCILSSCIFHGVLTYCKMLLGCYISCHWPGFLLCC